jgi:hypothetical protein
MPHVFEPAVTGRSKCRGCGRAIERGELRFGERVANPFADGETTLWFHPLCAAYKRPEAIADALAESAGTVPNREAIERAANATLARPRLPRIDGAERAKGQATCRHCRIPIPRGEWRIRLASYEEGQFSPLGYIHLACATDYFESADILEHVVHFSAALGDAEREELRSALTPV